MANLYNKYLLPKITNSLCSANPARKQREKIVPKAFGRVLEIGFGSGLNFEFYDPNKVDHLFALEPSEEMWKIAKTHINNNKFGLEQIKGFADKIPMETNEVDSILITYTLCSISNLKASFEEMKRVLKPEGALIFCEHGLAPDESVKKWQNRLNPVWKSLGGGCNLNRDIPQLIEDGAFKIEKIDTMYIPGFKFASYNYWGIAKPLG